MNPRFPMVVIHKRNLTCSVPVEQRFLPANRKEKLALLTRSDFTTIDKLIYHCKLVQRQQQRLVSVLRPSIPQLSVIPVQIYLYYFKEKIVSRL